MRDDLRVISNAADELLYAPSLAQRETKAAYWAVKGESLISGAIEQVTLADALRVTGDGRLQKWWAEPGFTEWFANSSGFRQRVEYLADLALDTVQSILINEEANPNARINAAKLMMEVAKKLPKQEQQVKFADQIIAGMSPEQLKAFIAKNTKELKSGESN